ncbi:prolipoprotein diacylglyceryl transferase family protein, partial [Lactobacillus jensenii]|uniref:prolipoprotein diacylglyceryl transferase family protein n=1 Tax=Lactobacillus jensenii TaxID=109790 RepID=UPI00287090DE
YIICYSMVRFFVEGMRTESIYIFNVIRVSQALSLVLFLAAIIFVIYRRKQGNLAW